MDLIQKDISFDSCACDERIFVRVIEPAEKEDRRGVLQIAHGMAEHSMLYMDFADYMARAGFVVALNDHLGHGKSVSKGALSVTSEKEARRIWCGICTSFTASCMPNTRTFLIF